MLRVFIGWDPRQPVSYSALCQSIIDNCSEPVAITPLVLPTLPIKRQGLTPFTYSRFLVPWLCNYEGPALFLDVDIMVRGDLAELFKLYDERYAVMVSRNQLRFEWASVMLFNCAKCKILTPEYVENADQLHGILWAEPEEIGDLPPAWNHLVGYDQLNPAANLVHFTQGVPMFPETAECEHAEEWTKYAQEASSSIPWGKLMGQSVHARPVYERLIAQGKLQVHRAEMKVPEK